MPTPPPWWIDTQVAPEAQLRSALRRGQSETASDPSRIASVSRLGEATDPLSRWSRPMAVAEPSPADARRQPLELDARPRHVEPIDEMLILGEQLLHLLVGAEDVL